MQSDTSLSHAIHILLSEMPVHIRINQAEDNGLITYQSLIMTLAVANGLFIRASILYFPENIDWTDKEVLIIDDVCDSGKSVEVLKKHIIKVSKNKDINIKYAVLVKNENNSSTIEPEYIGFFSHGEWLVGYGMDDQLLYRNIDHVVYKERNVI